MNRLVILGKFMEKSAHKLASHQSILKTGQFVPKIWGGEKLISVKEVLGKPEETEMEKELTMKQGFMCSVQLHEIKRERVFGLSGEIEVVFIDPKILEIDPAKISKQVVDDLETKVTVLKSPSDTVEILPGTIHYMRATKGDCIYREISKGPNETTRVWDPYKDLRSAEDQAK